MIQRWLAGEVIPEVGFHLNDSVLVVAGSLAGSVGAVISLERMDPEPSYIVELGSGNDVHLLQSQIQKLDDDGDEAV